MAEDADALNFFSSEPRNAEERRADAFFDVILSVAAALKYTHRTDGEDVVLRATPPG